MFYLKKIVSLFSLFTVSFSSALFSISSIKKENSINLINENNFKNNDNIYTGIHWFEPNIKIADNEPNLLVNSGLSVQEQQYCDFVFLKSIYGDNDNDKNKTTISINYSLSNIERYDNLYDIKDKSQDIKDFKIISNQKDAYGHIGIEEGKRLINKYLNNGLLSFNSKGIIPTRNTYFSYLFSKEHIDIKQTIFTDNYQKNNNVKNISDYISFNIHWWGSSIKLGYKLADPIIYGIINSSVSAAFFVDKMAIYNSVEYLKDEIKKWVEKQVPKAILYITEETTELDVTQPEVALIIIGVSSIISYLICKGINTILDYLTEQVQNFIDDLQNIINKKLHKLEGRQKLELEFNITWILFGTNIKILVPKEPPIITPIILVPANSNPIMPLSDLINGDTNNFIAIFNADDWSEIHRRITDKHNPVDYINNLGLKNNSINLTDDDWENSILPSLEQNYGEASPKDGYSFLMHIVNKKVVYANLNSDGTTTMPYANASEDIKELFSGNDNDHNLILMSKQFSQLLSAYNFDTNDKYWKEIQKDYHPKETNPYDYFYDQSIKNNFWIDNQISKDTIENQFKNLSNEIYIPDNKDDKNAKKTFTFSQFISLYSENDVLIIPSNAGQDGVKT